MCLKVIKPNTLYVKHAAKKYFHEPCHEAYKEDIQHKNELLEYIMELQGHRKLDPKIFAQLKDWQEKYQFKYKGIELTLRYFHEIKGNSYDEKGIGIVPYVYQEALNFHVRLNEVENKAKNNDYHLTEETVYMNDSPTPKKFKKLVNIEEITE